MQRVTRNLLLGLALLALVGVRTSGESSSFASSASPVSSKRGVQPGLEIVAANPAFGHCERYLELLGQAVQASWDRCLAREKTLPPPGTRVELRVTVRSDGSVKVDEALTRSADLATQIAAKAIRNRAPYGEWTDKMKSELGDEQALVVVFVYP